MKQLLNETKEEELNKKYREGGWTIQQIVHHCADSHMNSFLRFKWALTEERPIIKPYREEKWAELPDSKKYDVWTSVKLLEALHERWTYLLKHMSETDFSKSIIHPESQKKIRLDQNVIMYEWHGKHHLAHIQAALQQNII